MDDGVGMNAAEQPFHIVTAGQVTAHERATGGIHGMFQKGAIGHPFRFKPLYDIPAQKTARACNQ
jgi:hypothetical protein